MKKDLLTLAFLALVAFIVATVVFVIGEIGRQDRKGTPVAEIPTTGSPAPSHRSSDTPTPALESQPTATRTLTPESTATPTPCFPPAAWVLYTVQPGDTLYSIAAWYGMTAEEIQLANCLSSADEVLAGQSLYVPWLVTPSPTPCFPPADWDLYTVQPGETLFRIAARYGMSAEQMQRANCLASEALMAGQSIYVPYLIPTPVPEPEPTVLEGLLEELYFEPGGGGSPCQTCFGEQEPPEITGYDDLSCICLRGFPFTETITVDLHTPTGGVYSAVFRVEGAEDDATLVRHHPPLVGESAEPGFVSKDPDGVDLIFIRLWNAASLPADTWYAVASSDTAYATKEFKVERTRLEDLSAIPATGADPFEGERGLVHAVDPCHTRYTNIYSTGERVEIVGIDFPPSRDLALGIYHSELDYSPGTTPGVLVHRKVVTTDSQGNLRTLIRVEPSYFPGCYRVIVLINPNLEYDTHGDGGVRFTGRTASFQVR